MIHLLNGPPFMVTRGINGCSHSTLMLGHPLETLSLFSSITAEQLATLRALSHSWQDYWTSGILINSSVLLRIDCSPEAAYPWPLTIMDSYACISIII